MTRICILLFVLFGSNLSFAIDTAYVDMLEQAGWSNLNPEQQAKIIQDVARVHKPNFEPFNTKAAAVDQWVSVGEHIGQALAGAAKELKADAANFVNSPIGHVVVFLVVWHILGNMLLHIIGSGIFFVIAMMALLWHYKHTHITEVKYDVDKVDLFRRSRIISQQYSISSDWTLAYFVAIVVVVISSAMIFFMY